MGDARSPLRTSWFDVFPSEGRQCHAVFFCACGTRPVVPLIPFGLPLLDGDEVETVLLGESGLNDLEGALHAPSQCALHG